MIKVVIYDEMVNITTRLNPILKKKREHVGVLRQAGFDIKTNPLEEYDRIIYWLEFESEDEAAIWKLTHL